MSDYSHMVEDVDRVFKAINDAHRRMLLDRLRDDDGQSLAELCGHLPTMTRYGVMNHLRVLEEAGLVTTQKVGRRKLHYLNPVPIREIHDRWISRYAEPYIAAIHAIKARVEGGETLMERPAHVYKAYINGSQADVWEAITDGAKTERYFYGTRVESEWTPGSAVTYYHGNGEVAAEGEILAIDPPHMLDMTFTARWDPELAAEGPSREVWRLVEVNGMTELTIELWDTPPDSKRYEEFVNGFPYIVSGLKSLVETGAGLPAPY